jgi:hypothetical protein
MQCKFPNKCEMERKAIDRLTGCQMQWNIRRHFLVRFIYSPKESFGNIPKRKWKLEPLGSNIFRAETSYRLKCEGICDIEKWWLWALFSTRASKAGYTDARTFRDCEFLFHKLLFYLCCFLHSTVFEHDTQLRMYSVQRNYAQCNK